MKCWNFVSARMAAAPSFYSPLHSMAWAGAFGAASGSSQQQGASSPTPQQQQHGGTANSTGSSKPSYSSFGYPPTPPKESPGGGTPASLVGDNGVYGHGEAVTGDDVSADRLEMKPTADHLMQSMALSGYPVSRSHKCQEGQSHSPHCHLSSKYFCCQDHI